MTKKQQISLKKLCIKEIGKFVTSWVTGELFSYLKKIDKTIIESNLRQKNLEIL